ncbi:MAG: alginate lyase family protein, partial [Proteobacteria bacterium]|nr:alginate lyase family protein [Pseudomonadota bacterium]
PTPFLPAPPHADFDGSLRLRLLHREVRFAERIDWDWAAEGPLWAYHLHQHDYLRLPDLSPTSRARTIADWIERHPAGIGWDPHPLSLRILNWSKLLLTPGALPAELDGGGAGATGRAMRHSLAEQVETLSRNLEVRLQANHLLTNLIGIVFGGVLQEGAHAERWLACEGTLRHELEEQILPDGAHVERSPMYHSILLEQVLDLLNLARGGRRAPAALLQCLERAAARMLGALRVYTHPDGGIALFSDSAFELAHVPDVLTAYAASLGVAPRGPARPGVLDDAGYVRLAADPFELLVSVAGPLPAHQPGHAHCDALSFELCVGRERVVVDTGVTEYVPGALRHVSRATRSHATLEVGGAEQAEIWGPHRVGGRPRVSLVHVEPGRRAEATCAGWSTPETLHRRTWVVSAGRVEIRDRLSGQARPVRLTLPLAPGLEPDLGADGRAELSLAGGVRLRIALPEGLAWRVERAPYFPEFGRQVERACLVAEAPAGAFREGFWRFERR